MRIEDAKMVLDYAADIQKKLRTIAAEKDLLEGDLNCLRGIEYGGMPHGSGHSDSTADIAQRAEELGSLDRLRELEVQEVVLWGLCCDPRTNLVTKDCVHNSDFGIMAAWPQFGGNGA